MGFSKIRFKGRRYRRKIAKKIRETYLKNHAKFGGRVRHMNKMDYGQMDSSSCQYDEMYDFSKPGSKVKEVENYFSFFYEALVKGRRLDNNILFEAIKIFFIAYKNLLCEIERCWKLEEGSLFKGFFNPPHAEESEEFPANVQHIFCQPFIFKLKNIAPFTEEFFDNREVEDFNNHCFDYCKTERCVEECDVFCCENCQNGVTVEGHFFLAQACLFENLTNMLKCLKPSRSIFGYMKIEDQKFLIDKEIALPNRIEKTCDFYDLVQSFISEPCLVEKKLICVWDKFFDLCQSKMYSHQPKIELKCHYIIDDGLQEVPLRVHCHGEETIKLKCFIDLVRLNEYFTFDVAEAEMDSSFLGDCLGLEPIEIAKFLEHCQFSFKKVGIPWEELNCSCMMGADKVGSSITFELGPYSRPSTKEPVDGRNFAEFLIGECLDFVVSPEDYLVYSKCRNNASYVSLCLGCIFREAVRTFKYPTLEVGIHLP